MKMSSNNDNILAIWNYSVKEWNTYVKIERGNKKEDNIYYGIGIILVGVFGLMVFRGTTLPTALLFAVPFAILIPFLRMRISYPFLKKTNKNIAVTIFKNKLLVNSKKIKIYADNRWLKSINIIKSGNIKLLEFTIEWGTRRGATNDEYRILIPRDKTTEAQEIVNYFRDKSNVPDNFYHDLLKTLT